MLKLLKKVTKNDKPSGDARAIHEHLLEIEKKMEKAKGRRLERLQLEHQYYELKLKQILFDHGGNIEYR